MAMPLIYRFLSLTIRAPLTAIYRVHGEGWERIPESGPAVLASNHESLLDPFVMPICTRRVVHFMAKSELFRYPLVKQLMLGAGTFPVERGTADASAIARGLEVLARGEMIGIFPQGTCLPFRERSWRRGAARLAIESGAPLVPVCLVGTERAVRPHRLKLGLPRIRILVGEPIEPVRGAVGPEAADELTGRLKQAIEELRRPYGPPAHVWIDGPPRRL
jgi:1-acyl-sn-glycerol-3-phosphate acyltransferase